MTGIWSQIALVFALALIAAMIANRFRISTALTEIIVGMFARMILAWTIGADAFGVQEPWVKTLAGVGAIMLTFLAGAELDPDVFKLKWKEAAAIGVASFLVPAIGAGRSPIIFWDGRTRRHCWPALRSPRLQSPSSIR